VRIPGTQLWDIQTPYQYGGPLSNSDDPQFLKRAWAAYEQWCRENQVVVEFMRFHPLLQNGRFYGGTVQPNRSTVWIDLALPDLLASYEATTRNKIRKAIKKDLRVEWNSGFEKAAWFTQFYHAAMKEVGADEFYLFPEQYFRRLLAWEHARLAVCLQQDEAVTAAIFLIGPQVMEYHLSATNSTGKSFGSTNLLLHEAAMLGQSLGCRSLYLGGGTDRDPANPLLRFKVGFSPLGAEFQVGKYVHDESAYLLLRNQFSSAFSAPLGRVLFYR
jgi:lipid II:glycine glycyltransferase (peptidoglycan interpeptide bridge formation enzyme)